MENAQPLQEFGEILLDVARRDAGVDHRIQCCRGYAFATESIVSRKGMFLGKQFWSIEVHANAQPARMQGLITECKCL